MGITPSKGENMGATKDLGLVYWSIGYYSVNPDEDPYCGAYGGDDFPREQEAEARAFFEGKHPDDVLFIELVLMDQSGDSDKWTRHGLRENPDYDHAKAERERERFKREWQREIAMEAGMLHGVDAYNDAMGWGSEPHYPDDY